MNVGGEDVVTIPPQVAHALALYCFTEHDFAPVSAPASDRYTTEILHAIGCNVALGVKYGMCYRLPMMRTLMSRLVHITPENVRESERNLGVIESEMGFGDPKSKIVMPE